MAESVVNFRGDLIASLVSRGHDVTVLAGATDDATRSRIEALGVSFRPYPVRRTSVNPFRDLATLGALRRAFADLRPDAILAYTIKPVIWGGLALRSVGLASRFYALITGLGLTFAPGGPGRSALTALVARLYRLALRRAERVLFQNVDNKQVFLDRQIVDAQKCVVVPGSGVNLEHFAVAPLPLGDMVFLVVARLLGDKGLREYVRAARLLRNRHPHAEFRMLGPEDPSPDRIPPSEVREWQDSGIISYSGPVVDVRPSIRRCHVYVLPSYHEGLPRTVLEAMAMGRPIITTDVAGCRDTVIPGENGFLIPARDVASLAGAMGRFLDEPGLVVPMGHRSRQIAEQRFDVRQVNELILETMRLV